MTCNKEDFIWIGYAWVSNNRIEDDIVKLNPEQWEDLEDDKTYPVKDLNGSYLIAGGPTPEYKA